MKLTLNQAWKDCLRMWKWIAKQRQDGCTTSVVILKRVWFETQQSKYSQFDVDAMCFFCEYDIQNHKEWDLYCKYCPGKLVDKRFGCEAETYDYHSKPIKFYEKLLQLYAKRKEVKL